MMEKHSLKEIIGLLKDRKISEKELLQHYFSRINKFNPSLNALVSLRSIDEVLKDLENLKGCSVQKKTKSLFGVPLAVKDLIDVKGLPTTYGVPKYKNNVAKKNSIIVDRLIDSGALIIGKTNTPEWGLGSHTFNRAFGATANPYDVSKTAGGSSGGAEDARTRMLRLKAMQDSTSDRATRIRRNLDETEQTGAETLRAMV